MATLSHSEANRVAGNYNWLSPGKFRKWMSWAKSSLYHITQGCFFNCPFPPARKNKSALTAPLPPLNVLSKTITLRSSDTLTFSIMGGGVLDSNVYLKLVTRQHLATSVGGGGGGVKKTPCMPCTFILSNCGIVSDFVQIQSGLVRPSARVICFREEGKEELVGDLDPCPLSDGSQGRLLSCLHLSLCTNHPPPPSTRSSSAHASLALTLFKL